MNAYNLKKIEKCYVCGNIDKNLNKFINLVTSNLSKYEKKMHKKEIERQERLKNKMYDIPAFGGPIRRSTNSMYKKLKSSFSQDGGYNDSVIIVSGNCGIGSKSQKYYEEVFSNLDKILADNNCYIFFVRGNNDDPSYFENRVIDFEHVKTIPDYSVVSLKTFNCLCIGGSVSIDKEWKLFQEKEFGKKLFYEDEAPRFDGEKLSEILSKFRISCVVTSTAPTFVYPGTNAYKRSRWFSSDKSIIDEFSKERKTIDRIYEKLMDSESKPYVWLYGRFKLGHTDKINDIVFASLCQYTITQVNNIISSFFGVNTSEELGVNNHTFDDLFEDERKPKLTSTFNHLAEPRFIEEPRREDDEELEDLDAEIEIEERNGEDVAENVPQMGMPWEDGNNEPAGFAWEPFDNAINTLRPEDIQATREALGRVEFDYNLARRQ